MFIELEPIFNNIGAKKEFSYSFSPEDGGIEAPVNVSGAVENRAGVVTLTANTAFQDMVACDRCLKPTPRSFQKQFTHILTPTLNSEDNDDFILVEDMHFDLNALLREDILLELPTKVLCKADCKGLCPMCGANRNETACGCKKPVDPRLAVLQELLSDS